MEKYPIEAARLSRKGEGSTFWFEIPADPACNAQAIQHADNGLEPRLQRRRVLLVEDNLVNQQIALGFLRHLGQEVVVASDGLEALTKVSEGRFDVVLMDMQMPNMDGIDATRKIREMGGVFASVPIVAMTANASDEDRILCANAGMSDFQSKPITLAKLARILARSDHAVTCACPSVNDVGMAISNTRHQEIANMAQALRHKLIITNSELLDLMRAVDEERRSLAA